MRSVSLISILFLALSQLAEPKELERCPSIIKRREIRQLSKDEWALTKKTLNQMNTDGWFLWFAFVHIKFFHEIHQLPVFLPWHRRFIRDLENVARGYQPTFALPFWDSSIDFSAPDKSIVLTNDYLGGTGVGEEGCLGNGLQSAWTMRYPEKHCLRREFSMGDEIAPWISPESITSDIQLSKTFQDIATRIEYGVHATVHNGLGGDMVSAGSPNDFAFFLHHSNVDRLWWKWQNIEPGNVKMYDGTNDDGPVKLTDPIAGYSETVEDVMRVGYGTMCYTYDDQIKFAKRDGNLASGAANINTVLQVPQMSLATGTNSSTLAKFFPLIAGETDTPSSAIDLPNVASKKALKFASENVNTTAIGQKEVVVGSIAKTVINQSNKMDLSDIVVNANDKDSVLVNNFSRQKFDKDKIDAKTQDVLSESVVISTVMGGKINVMPLPSKISDLFLKENHYDPVKYQAYYNEKIGLVNALNSDGYVSPYT